MAHRNPAGQDEEQRRYQCARCGAESYDAVAEVARYCALCGCSEAELRGLPDPAATGFADPVTGVHRLPVA